MVAFNSLYFLDCHATFETRMSSCTLIFFVIDNLHSLNGLSAIDTRHRYVWTHCLMPFDLLSDAFGFTTWICLAFYWLIPTFIIMISDIKVIEYLITSHQVIPTLKLHLLELLLHLLFDIQELWILTLHWTHACLIVKLFKTFIMESFFASFTFNRVNQYCLTEAAEIFFFELIFCQQISSI